jgi:hypothetical protein
MVRPRPLTAGLARLRQGQRLGVRLAGAPVPALADDPPVAHDDRADARIGRGGVEPELRQLQRAAHVLMVGLGEHAGTIVPAPPGALGYTAARPARSTPR